jgi:Methyltransferase domain
VNAGDADADRWAEFEAIYLASDDPRGQSGFRGDEVAWRRAKEPIVEAIDHDGTLLDIGCANGLLMESLVEWALERGFRIEPFGLDRSPRLAELARERLPRWSERIFQGDATQWAPPQRFDFVRTELVYATEDARPAYVRRLLDHIVAPAGRLIVCGYGSASRNDPAAPVREMLGEWGFAVEGDAVGRNEQGFPVTRVAWIDGPDRAPATGAVP